MPAYSGRIGRYPLAVFLAVFAVLSRVALTPVVGLGVPYILFYPAVAISSWYGGFGPGLVTALLSTFAGWYFFLPPAESFGIPSTADSISLLLFLAVSCLIANLQHRCRNAELSATQSLHLANERLAELEKAEKRRCEAERATEEERKWARAVLSSVGDGLITTDLEGKVTFLNTVAEQLTGWRLADAVTQPISTVFHIVSEETRAPVENPVRRVLEDGRIVGLANHTALISRQGLEIPIDDSAAPIFSRDGKILGAVLVFRDIRDHQKVENNLRLLAARLARSNEDLAAFGHVISHDLQEPLRNVVTLTELLRDEHSPMFPFEGKEYVRLILASGQRMVRMIRGLLEYSLMAHGPEPEPEDVSLMEAVVWAERNLQDRIQETGAIIQYEPLPKVRGDRLRFVQLFQNLIANSLKHRSPGVRPRIAITARDLGSEWQVRVEDNGPGISPENREKIFQLFNRVSADAAGWGIGLAICKRVVESHGGRIWVEPGSSSGSAFLFTLPK